MSTLGYWNIRGLGQVVRFLLEYVGEQYKEAIYECGEGPEYNRDGWFNAKPKLGLDFPNLPYYVDGKRKISQSNAILRYLGRKHKLDGTTEDEKVRIDLIMEEVADLRGAWFRLCYTDNARFDENKDVHLKNLKVKLSSFEQFLGNNRFFAGDNVSFADFPLYEIIDEQRELEPKVLEDFPKLNAYMERFEALPTIKAYRASDKFYSRPINNKMAAFK